MNAYAKTKKQKGNATNALDEITNRIRGQKISHLALAGTLLLLAILFLTPFFSTEPEYRIRFLGPDGKPAAGLWVDYLADDNWQRGQTNAEGILIIKTRSQNPAQIVVEGQKNWGLTDREIDLKDPRLEISLSPAQKTADTSNEPESLSDPPDESTEKNDARTAGSSDEPQVDETAIVLDPTALAIELSDKPVDIRISLSNPGQTSVAWTRVAIKGDAQNLVDMQKFANAIEKIGLSRNLRPHERFMASLGKLRVPPPVLKKLGNDRTLNLWIEFSFLDNKKTVLRRVPLELRVRAPPPIGEKTCLTITPTTLEIDRRIATGYTVPLRLQNDCPEPVELSVQTDTPDIENALQWDEPAAQSHAIVGFNTTPLGVRISAKNSIEIKWTIVPRTPQTDDATTRLTFLATTESNDPARASVQARLRADAANCIQLDPVPDETATETNTGQTAELQITNACNRPAQIEICPDQSECGQNTNGPTVEPRAFALDAGQRQRVQWHAPTIPGAYRIDVHARLGDRPLHRANTLDVQVHAPPETTLRLDRYAFALYGREAIDEVVATNTRVWTMIPVVIMATDYTQTKDFHKTTFDPARAGYGIITAGMHATAVALERIQESARTTAILTRDKYSGDFADTNFRLDRKLNKKDGEIDPGRDLNSEEQQQIVSSINWNVFSAVWIPLDGPTTDLDQTPVGKAAALMEQIPPTPGRPFSRFLPVVKGIAGLTAGTMGSHVAPAMFEGWILTGALSPFTMAYGMIAAFATNLVENDAGTLTIDAPYAAEWNLKDARIYGEFERQEVGIQISNPTGTEHNEPDYITMTLNATRNDYPPPKFYPSPKGSVNEFAEQSLRPEATRTPIQATYRIRIDTAPEQKTPTQFDTACQTGDLKGRTGPDALPRVRWNWQWNDAYGIPMNACDADNPNNIHCDATQFAITIAKKLDALNEFLKTNDKIISCPKNPAQTVLEKIAEPFHPPEPNPPEGPCWITRSTQLVDGTPALAYAVSEKKDQIRWTRRIPDIHALTQLTKFESTLMRDSFTNDFQNDFTDYYLNESFFDTPDYFKLENPNGRIADYFRSTERLQFHSGNRAHAIELAPGTYRTELVVNLDENSQMFDHTGKPSGKTEIRLFYKHAPNTPSALYHLPIDGDIGRKSPNGRLGYGTQFTQESDNTILVNQEGERIEARPNDTTDALIQATLKRTNDLGQTQTNVLIRGQILEINVNHRTQTKLLFSPSTATPVWLTHQFTTDNPIAQFEILENNTPADTGNQTGNWQRTDACANNPLADIRIDLLKKNRPMTAYALNPHPLTKTRARFHQFYYTPVDKTYGIKGITSTTLLATPHQPFATTAPLSGVPGIAYNDTTTGTRLDTIENALQLVENGHACIYDDGRQLTLWWNQQALATNAQHHMQNLYPNEADTWTC